MLFSDGKDPVVKEDKEYPEWVFKLTEKLPTRNQLLQMIDEAGGIDGDLTVLGEDNLRRAKRLITLDEIKKNNLRAATE
jgi:Mitochondrial ribosomal protein L37